MKLRIVEKMKKHSFLLFALLIVLIVFLPYVLFNDHVWAFSGDFSEQQLRMYIQGYNRIHDGALPFWDWSNFLGNNYFGASTFYFLGSPFFWLTMLLPSVDLVIEFFLTLNIIKSLMCVCFTYLWLFKVTKSDLGSAIGGLIVTFSGFILINYANNHMLDAVLFMPLVLYFVEKYLFDDKKTGLILSIGYLGIVNYYFLYLFIPFMLLYTLFRYFDSIDKFDLVNMLKKAGGFVLCLMVGLLICSITLIPSMMALSGNDRVSDFNIGLNTIGKDNIFRFITSFINPVNDWRTNSNFFVNVNDSAGIGWNGGMSNYSLIIFPFLIIPFLSLKKIKGKITIIALYICYGIFAIFPMFYILFNQNYETRWMLNIIFINALLVAFTIANVDKIKKKLFVISSISVSIFMVLCLLITAILNLSTESWGFSIIIRNVCVLSIVLIIYGILFYKFKNKNNEKSIKLLIIFIVLFEVLYSFFNVFYNLDDVNKPINGEDIENLKIRDSDVFDELSQIDESFYRIDIPTLLPLSLNNPMSNNYKSFTVYHSILNYSQTDFILNRFSSKGAWYIKPEKGKTMLKTLLSSKYWMTYAEDDFNYDLHEFESMEDIVPFGYEFFKTIDGRDVFINNYHVPIAYGMSNQVSIDVFNELSVFEQDMFLLNNVAVNDNNNIDYIMHDMLDISDKVIDKKIDISSLDQGIIYYMSEAMNNGYYVLDENDNAIQHQIFYDEFDYGEINLPKGSAEIKLYEAEFDNLFYDNMEWIDEWYDSLLSHSMYDICYDDNSISGKINLVKDMMIVTSIPYYDGWQIVANGEKINYSNINNGFIGFELQKGTHEITMNFIPPGLKLGSILSFFGLIICFFCHFCKKK